MGKDGINHQTLCVYFTKENFKNSFGVDYGVDNTLSITIERQNDVKPYPVGLQRLQVTDPNLQEYDDGIILTVVEGIVVKLVIDLGKESVESIPFVLSKNLGLCKVNLEDYAKIQELTDETTITTDYYGARLLSPDESLKFISAISK